MDAENPITPQRIAEWMLEELERRGYLDQDVAVDHIEKQFGKQFTCENDNGNTAIGKAVLKAFRKLTEKSVVWDREDRSWRKRKPKRFTQQNAGLSLIGPTSATSMAGFDSI